MATEGTQYKTKQLLFSGFLDLDHDPLVIGDENFSELENTRYADNGLGGAVSGYSKINTTALATYLKGRSGIQLTSTYETKSRVLIQAENAAETASVILENKTDIPDQGAFETTSLHTDASGAGLGRFSKWPGGSIAYCNGKEALVYGGDESRCAGFINYAPDGSFEYDYSEVVQNIAEDTKNIATLHRVTEAVDANTMLLLHLDNNVTDSSPATAHTVTNNNVTYDATAKVFGTHAAVFNGTNADLTVPDNADFDFSGGTFTVDCRVKLDALPGSGKRFPLYQQETAGTGNDWFEIYIDENGAVKAQVKADHTGVPATDVDLTTADGVIAAGTWYHIEIVESGDDWYIFVDGVQRAYLSDADRCADYSGIVQIGYNGDGAGYYLDGKIDEYRVSNSARHTGAFEVPIAAYGSSTYRTYWYLESTRPIQAFKEYVKTANTTAGTRTVEYWNGASWASVAGLSDGTAVGGIPCAQTGTVSFTSTVASAKVKAINSRVGYWYRISITECDATTTFYHVTVDAPMQAVVDLWDGIYRTVISCQSYNGTTYADYTTNVASDDYNSANAATYAQFGSLASTNHFVLGFQERVMGVNAALVAGSVNTTANTVLTVYYWSGTAWVSVGVIEDGTFAGNKSFASSGHITWNPPDDNTEFPTEVANEVPLYYYKFKFSQNLSADVRADSIKGISAPKKILGGYKFPFMFANKAMLCGCLDGKEGHRVDYGMTYATEGWNGEDSSAGYYGPLYFGDAGSELTAAAEIYNRFGSSIYNVAVFCKPTETYILDGYDGETFKIKKIDDTKGCPAPLTMDTAAVAYGVEEGATRNIAIWLSYDGPIVFDAALLVPIPQRIKPYFDKKDSRCINFAAIERSRGWVDPDNKEYNLGIPSGAGQTEINVWLCMDLVRKKWFVKKPSAASAAYPQAAFRVKDEYGTQYVYGCRDNGYMVRLENGTTWDGAAITQVIGTADMVPTGRMWDQTKIQKALFAAVGVSEDVDVEFEHYADGETAPTDLGDQSIMETVKRHIRKMVRIDRAAWSHRFRFTASSSSTAGGFRPLGWTIQYDVTKEARGQ